MTLWRAAGLNYVRYSQLAAEVARKCLKSTAAKEAEKRSSGTLKMVKWEDRRKMESVSMRTKQTDSGIGIDVSMNSASDMGLSFAGDRTSTDLGLLDLDSVLPDDEESWLYGPSSTTAAPSNSDTFDLIAWLQNAAASLEPKQRRALSQKLENIAKKKQVEDGMSADGLDPTDSLIAEIDGLLTDNRSLPRRDSGGSDDTEFYDAASDLDSTDPSMPIRTSTPDYGLSEEAMKLAAQTRTGSNQPAFAPKPKMVTLQSPTVELSTPDFVSAEEKMLGRIPPPLITVPSNASAVRPKSPATNVIDGLVPSAVKIHPELHPDLQDIQLLANMQEEDLRKALEKLQQQRLRKISQNSDHGNSGGPANSGKRPPVHNNSNNANMDRFDALAKEISLQQQQQTREAPLSASGPSPAAARITQQQSRRSLEARAANSVRAKSPRPVNSFPSTLNGTSLQKSLPNLAASRSTEFSKGQNAEIHSEQGSYNDINERVSPAPGAAVKKSGLRQPTPRRVSAGVGGRTGIPSPAQARTAIPMPTSGIKRVSGVGNGGRPSTGQPTAARPVGSMGAGGAQSQQRQLNESWNDDCF